MQAGIERASRGARAIHAVTMAMACAAPPVAAQSIDPYPARATLGEPLSIEVRVRHPQAPDASVTPRCIQAEAQIGDAYLGPDDLRLSIRPDAVPGWQRVKVTHPSPVQEPVVQTRIALTCGAPYVREFPILVDPPASSGHPRANLPEPPGAPGRAKAAAAARPSATPDLPDLTRKTPAATPHDTTAMPNEVPPEASPAPLQRPHATPSANGISPFLLKELEQLRAEHQRSLTLLSSMEARLGHRERMLGSPTWPWLLTALAILLFGLGRVAQDAWRAQRPVVQWVRRTKQRHALEGTPTQAPADDAVPVSVEPSAPTASPPVAVAEPKERGTRWAHAEFGQASFEAAPDPAFMQQLEKYEVLGYPVASVALLEKALGEGPGKNPWILLKLLDLYAQLGQARQREGVAAQLEALYNVRIPVSDGQPLEGRGLLEQPETLSHVTACWHSARTRDAIESLLSHPVAVEPLDLSAFRDTMLLHAIAQAHEESPPDAGDFNPVIDWTTPSA